MDNPTKLLACVIYVIVITDCAQARQVKGCSNSSSVYKETIGIKWTVADSTHRYVSAGDTTTMLYRRSIERYRNNTSTVKPPEDTAYYYLKSADVFYVED